MSATTTSSINKSKNGLKEQPQLSPREKSHMMDHVVAVILGGGEGKRLYPLTLSLCKPAISFGGKYKLIDVPISNALNSGCHKIFILTQFLTSSLNQHILSTYRFDMFSSGFIKLLPAEQKPSNASWFQGTADAVRQTLNHLLETDAEYFLILSGDQLYSMDFTKMLRYARETDADLVIASLPVPEESVHRLGTLQVNEEGRITAFYEKPNDPAIIKEFRLSSASTENLKITDPSKQFLGSMGIYLFKREVLVELLLKDTREDFGKHIIPTKVNLGNSYVYVHDGYWEDVGTIETFFQANMDLIKPEPEFNFYEQNNSIFTAHYNLPSAKISYTQMNDVLICEGSIVEADELSQSILGPRSIVRKGSIIRETYIMGHEFYTPPSRTQHCPDKLEIGEQCILRKCILDKHVCLGKGVQLINKNKLTHYNGNGIFIRDGIIVVARGTHLPDGFIL